MEFWVNMDTVDGQHAAMTATVQLMEDRTQRLLLISNGAAITNFPGLSTDFQTVRWQFDAVFTGFTFTTRSTNEQDGG
jgi:NAD(P)-dependent dehydrogenase (short-subunit alcohol dehydrogenase family)